jgi:Bacterial protein of unknown function (DUF899)
MYGKRQTKACPMCTAWIDGTNGVAHHLAQNLDFAVVAATEVSALRAHARARGWDKPRLLSAGKNTFKYDLGSEDREGHQDSTISVFTQNADGTLRHFYSVHPGVAPRHQGARHRPPRSHLALPGPHSARPWQLVHHPRLRHQSPSRLDVICNAISPALAFTAYATPEYRSSSGLLRS